MATFKQLQDRVKANVIDLPAELIAAVPRYVNQAIRDAQDAHNYRAMEHTIEFTTTTGDHALGELPFFKDTNGDPWIRHADGGETEIEWAPSIQELVKYHSITAADDEGRPKHLIEASVEASLTDFNVMHLDVYPFPDDQSDHPDGLWRIRVPYWRYLAPLVNDGDFNWFTINAELYVEQRATAYAFRFNEDEDRSDRWLLLSTAQLKIVESIDKRSKLKKNLVLVPRRDVHATYKQSRL